MDYYRELWYNEKKEIADEKYLVMLDLELEELKKFSKKEKVVGEYMDKLEKLNKDPEFYQYMSHEEDERKIYNSRMYEAEQKGKNAEKIATAKKLLEKNMSIEEIMEITSLSQQEIEKLKSTN